MKLANSSGKHGHIYEDLADGVVGPGWCVGEDLWPGDHPWPLDQDHAHLVMT